ncbi:MAG: AraC family transcriptional regulator [Pseudomonadota bacterium]
MKSNLEFYEFESRQPSDCGQVLEIEFSSSGIDWPGVVLEKGSSPCFYPDNVYTPYFYFALALDEELHWRVATESGMKALKTTPGDIWINPPGTPFSHQISEPCYFVILAVKAEEFLESATLNIKGKALQFLNNYNVHDEVIKGIIDLFLIEATTGGRNGYPYLKNLLSLLSTHYIQSYSNYSDLQNQLSSASKFDQSQVNKVDQYIDQHISTHITVDDLADLLHCSKFYFLREFKKLMGITPYQYLMDKRLERARHLLSSDQGTIASIGFDLGFNDQAHFTRAFKKQFGLTPGKFQKQSKE